MSSPKEIERKFLIRELPSFIPELPFVSIKQGYLSLDPNGREIRLRQKNETYWLTVKTDGTLERSEYETPLSQQQFERLWPAVEENIIHKTRYLFQKSGHSIEIDVYEQPLKGLVVVEVEFADKEAASAYTPESWMDKEITHLNFMKNKNLLQFQSFEQIKDLL